MKDNLIEIKEEVQIGDIILEKGDKIEILSENYGQDDDIVFMVKENKEGDGRYIDYRLYTGASMPDLIITLKSRERFQFLKEIEKTLKEIFEKYY